MGPTECLEMSEHNCQPTLLNNREGQRTQLHHGRSLKS